MEPETKWHGGGTFDENRYGKAPVRQDKIATIATVLVLVFIIWSMFFMGQPKSPDEGWQQTTNTVRTTESDSFGNVNTSEMQINGVVNNNGTFIPDPRSL